MKRLILNPTSLVGFAFCGLYSFLYQLTARVCFQVGVIGNLVHSSPHIKKAVLLAGALQPVIGLLRYCWLSHCCLFLLNHPFHITIVVSKILMDILLNLYIAQLSLFRKPKRSSFVIGSICSSWFRLQGGLTTFHILRPKAFALVCVFVCLIHIPFKH